MIKKNMRAPSMSLAAAALGFGVYMLAAPALADGHGNHMSKPQAHEYAIASDMATKALVLDAAKAGSRLVAVGEFGHVLLSDDNGGNWRQAASVPTRNTLTNVIFMDNQTGFAVGHEATILPWAAFPTHLKPKTAAKAGPSALWWKTAMTISI